MKKTLKEARKSAKLTQEQLGQMVGVTGQTIKNIEAGRNAPSLPLALKIKKVLLEIDLQQMCN